MGINRLDETVKAIFQRLFQVDPEEVNDQARRGQLDGWDSLGHVQLLESLKQEFKIEIPVEQALDMETVEDVKRIVQALSR